MCSVCVCVCVCVCVFVCARDRFSGNQQVRYTGEGSLERKKPRRYMLLHGKNELVAVFGWPLIKKLACPKRVFHIIRSVLIWTLKDTFYFFRTRFHFVFVVEKQTIKPKKYMHFSKT